ncbi:MAG: energy-coupling factor transporter ATPase [Chloroflexia bacterium]
MERQRSSRRPWGIFYAAGGPFGSEGEDGSSPLDPLSGRLSEPLIRAQDLHFTYPSGGEGAAPALDGIDLEIRPGEFVALIGPNGSGKTTLARHFNALLLPTSGDVWVRGMNTRNPAFRQEIRRTVAMVFQNPDHQFVATVVEEEVAFGPENLGLPEEELRRRVDWALEAVGLSALRHRSPQYLSGGQKQRLALAGALAMQPQCLVLDEATAMLDPAGRRALLEVVRELHGRGMTVIAITQNMEEVVQAERVIVMAGGRIVLQGPPRQVLAQEEVLYALGLDVPPMVRLSHRLHARIPDFPDGLLTAAEVVAAVREYRDGGRR